MLRNVDGFQNNSWWVSGDKEPWNKARLFELFRSEINMPSSHSIWLLKNFQNTSLTSFSFVMIYSCFCPRLYFVWSPLRVFVKFNRQSLWKTIMKAKFAFTMVDIFLYAAIHYNHYFWSLSMEVIFLMSLPETFPRRKHFPDLILL